MWYANSWETNNIRMYLACEIDIKKTNEARTQWENLNSEF